MYHETSRVDQANHSTRTNPFIENTGEKHAVPQRIARAEFAFRYKRSESTLGRFGKKKVSKSTYLKCIDEENIYFLADTEYRADATCTL